MAVSGTSATSDRNYLDYINSDKTNNKTTGKVYNAVFSNGEDDDLTISDFFDMMILQLTNQDFMNPVDDTQYLTQMAQFATMQEMMDLCQFSKQNYVTSMLGKEVTVNSYQIGGKSTTVTGKVEKISIQNDEYKVYVDGKPYDLNKITQIAESGASTPVTQPDNSDNKTDNSDKADDVQQAENSGVTNGIPNSSQSGETDKTENTGNTDTTESTGSESADKSENADASAKADG